MCLYMCVDVTPCYCKTIFFVLDPTNNSRTKKKNLEKNISMCKVFER